MEQAFTALRLYARNHNLRLVDVAEAVIGGSLVRQRWTGRQGRGRPYPDGLMMGASELLSQNRHAPRPGRGVERILIRGAV